MKDPMEQANRTKYTVKEMIDNPLPEGEYCWAESAVWFPSLSDRKIIADMPNTYHPETVLMDWALTNTKQAIEQAYQFYDTVHRTKLSDESGKLIIRTLAPAFRAVPSLATIYAEQEHHFLRLTNEQSGLLDYLDEQPTAAIQGSAGTGKTLLAMEKARRLSESGKVLFLCFNRFLMDDLRKKNQDTKVSVYNLPSLVMRNVSPSTLPTEEDITAYLNDYDKIGTWSYRHIVIDEGQDFSDAHLNILAAIAAIQDGAFYIFYDKNQLIQQRELPEWLRQAECRLVLRRNCRNTQHIATTAGRPIDVEPVLWEKTPRGETPNFHILEDAKSFASKLEELISVYINAKIPMDQIAILTAKTEERSVLSGVEKIGKWLLTTRREGAGILFTTVRKFKGLESAAIIITDVDALTFDTPEARNLFYVGASRAKSFLDIVTVLDKEQLQTLGAELNGGHAVKNVATKIASTLKVRIT
jgi:Superfamily I DNA and RNA helicases